MRHLLSFVVILMIAGPEYLGAQTLQQTAAWIESEMPSLTTSAEYPVTFELRRIEFDECRLKFELVSILLASRGQSSVRSYRIILAQVDTSQLNLVEGSRVGLEPSLGIQITARPGAGMPFTSDLGSTGRVTIPARDPESGRRVIRAIKRAVALCGRARSTF
jgi:hypothetical protein